MQLRLLVALATALAGAGLSNSASGFAQGSSSRSSSSILIATPSAGHSGDVIYLSGSGLDPLRKLFVTMACPNFFGAKQNEMVSGAAGPKTDRQGTFAGFAFHTLTLHGVASSACEIYVPAGANPIGPDFPASYTIIADDEPLPYCDSHICISVEHRLTAGKDLLVMHAWPGAKGTARVSGSPQYRRQYTLPFDWQGLAVVVLDHATSLRPRSVHLDISAQLGKASGRYSGSVHLTANPS